MKIRDLENQIIKIGKTSITCINEDTGKTKGIVRDVPNYANMKDRDRFEYFSKIKCIRKYSENIFIEDKTIYLVYMLHSNINECQKMIDLGYDYMEKSLNEKLELKKILQEHPEIVLIEPKKILFTQHK